MLPVTPAGHSGSPARPASTGAAGSPSPASASLAHRRPTVNSARRRGPAVRTTASSAGKSFRIGSASGPTNSAAAPDGGRISAITAAALLRSQRHPDRVHLGRAGVAPGMGLVAAEVQRAPDAYLVQLPGDGELEQAGGDVHQFLARVLHGLAPAG